MIRGSKLNRQILLENLTKGVCKVIFRKVTDGRYRSMICTLDSKYVPTRLEGSINSIAQASTGDLDILPVFDIIKYDWRSFRITNIEMFYTPEDLKENKEITRKKLEIKERE